MKKRNLRYFVAKMKRMMMENITRPRGKAEGALHLRLALRATSPPDAQSDRRQRRTIGPLGVAGYYLPTGLQLAGANIHLI